jgi:hypothetical protein
MKAVREAFDNFNPLSAFCRKCLYPVSEHFKSLLTIRKPRIVFENLKDFWVHDNQPWFEFPENELTEAE